jgi:nitroreductase
VTDSAGSTEQSVLAAALMQSRQTILPRRLLAPGPDAAQLQQILAAAASAPDHGQLLPWRFVLIPIDARDRLGAAFAASLLERDADATPTQVAQAREKAHRAPLLMLAIVDAVCGDAAIDLHERMVSAGCAIQNLLLMATAMGYGSALTSGKAIKSTALRSLFGLQDGEHALCFISVGSVQAARKARERPQPQDYVITLPAQGVPAARLGAAPA